MRGGGGGGEDGALGALGGVTGALGAGLAASFWAVGKLPMPSKSGMTVKRKFGLSLF